MRRRKLPWMLLDQQRWFDEAEIVRRPDQQVVTGCRRCRSGNRRARRETLRHEIDIGGEATVAVVESRTGIFSEVARHARDTIAAERINGEGEPGNRRGHVADRVAGSKRPHEHKTVCGIAPAEAMAQARLGVGNKGSVQWRIAVADLNAAQLSCAPILTLRDRTMRRSAARRRGCLKRRFQA